MGVERVDYSSDDEYQQALQMEELEYQQAMETKQQEDMLTEYFMNLEQFCFTCIYWNESKEDPLCWAVKGECNYMADNCDFREQDASDNKKEDYEVIDF